jgi:hypothetical protein
MSDYCIPQEVTLLRPHALPAAICHVCGGPCKVNRYRAPRCRDCAHKQHGPQAKRAREYVPEPEPELAKIELPPCTGTIRVVDGKRWLSCPVDCARHPISDLSPGWNRAREQHLYAPGYDQHAK